MARTIIALIPAGEVYHHDRVRMVNGDDPAKDVWHQYNSGDMFVYEASLRLLEFDRLITIPTNATLTDTQIDQLNEEASFAFLRGSNYVHHQMQWGNLPTILEKLKVPLMAFGIGAQAPKQGQVELSEDTIRVLKMISDRSEWLGVRGEFTASVLHGLGIYNVKVIGCPSLFRFNRPRLHIRVPEMDDVRRVGITFTRGLASMYCEDLGRARQLQLDVIRSYAERFDTVLLSQCELPEKAYYYRDEARIPKAYAELIADKWFEGPDDPMVQLYQEKMFFGASPAAYDDIVRTLDAVVGLRLHGNIIALSNSVPAVYVTYDTRTRELVDYLGIPAYDIMANTPFRLEDFLVQERFDRFADSYAAAYQRMKTFLVENGVHNRMH